MLNKRVAIAGGRLSGDPLESLAGIDEIITRGDRAAYVALLRALHTLADYPMLAALAAERTQATRLDGRACRAIYEDARQRIDWQSMPPHEEQQVPSAEVVRRGWVINAPRLRDQLERLLGGVC